MIRKQAVEKAITLHKYPAMKMGFTTANFVKVLPLTAPNVKKMIDFASHQGWSFIELRDPEANLTLEECKELAVYAQQNCVEVVYALNVGPMDSRYFEVLARGIANTLVFEGPKMIRSGVNGTEFVNDQKKLYWSAEEFAKLVQNINQAANTATMFGLQLSVENAREGFKGDGVKTFGTAELFGVQGVNTNVGWQLDTANFFSVSRTANDPNEVKEFFEQHIEKIDYIHLKSSKDSQTQPILCDSDLSLDLHLDALSKAGKVYVIIELPAAETLEAVHENHRKSLAYLNRSY
jgi:sugar phosphate isomerase/epimerase